MSRFDLSKAQDFQRLTLGQGAGVLQTLALFGRDPTQWDIVEASYNGVRFHVFNQVSVYQAGLAQIQDSGGRRKVKYKYPYRDGQTTDDLGRSPETFEIEALVHGQRYLEGLKALLAALNQPNQGVLIHPVRGLVNCVAESWTLTHKSDSRKAVAVSITFIEHNFQVNEIQVKEDKSVKGALSRALDALNRISTVATNVIGAGLFARSLVNQITTGLNEYSLAFGNTLSNINQTFNKRGSSEFPGLLPTNLGGTRNSNGTLTTSTFPVVLSPSDRFANIPISEETALALTVNQLTKDVATLRQTVAALIELLSTGDGSIVFYEDILSLKQTAILMQNALETGVASSNAKIIDYNVPRLMSLREIAFANSLSVERVSEIEALNPELESTNYVPRGTILKVPNN